MKSALEAIQVTRSYGSTHALLEADLQVRQGETLALVGESGSGKTTLLRLFNRMVEPTSGRVLIGGIPAGELDPIGLRRRTGYVQQEGGLLPHWTVARNVGLVPALLGWDSRRTRDRTRELLDMVGLSPETYAARYPAELSGGQRQRVAVARALAAEPDVVLLDEPFGALDAITRKALQRQFHDLKTRLGKTMVLVTHDLDEAFRLADRIAVLKEGRVLRVDTPEELRRHPGNDYVRDLLSQDEGL